MKKIEIPLQKRKNKFRFYMAVTVFMAWMFLLSIGNLLVHGFNGSAAFFGGLMAFGMIAVGMAINDYYKQIDPKLAVESDGVIVRFYISHNTGKANESKNIQIENMKRFYLVTKKTRYFVKDKSFEFEPKSGILKTNVDVFPSLSEIDDEGVQKVLQFMSEVAPEIALGYYGSTFSQLFKKWSDFYAKNKV